MLNRNKNIILQIKWSFVFKILAFIVYYISISYQVKILGNELYGVWATLLSKVTWIVFFDFGLGKGIKNYLTKALTLKNIKEAKEIIMTGYIAISILSLLLFFLMYILTVNVNLQDVFNTKILTQKQLERIVILLFAFVFFHFIISFVKQFIFAIQKNALNDFEQFLFYIFLCSTLIYLYTTGYTSILSIVLAYGISLILSKLILTFIFFYKNNHLLPSVKNFQKKIMGKLMNVGMSFFALQLVSMFILLSDKMIIIQLLGPQEVTSYDIVYRLFSTVLILHGIVNAPMWSSYTEAYTKKESNWILKNLNKMKFFVIFLSGVSVVLYFFSNELIYLWIGEDIEASNLLILTMAIYVIILAWCNNYAFFLNGINAIRIQFYTLLIGAILNIPLSIVLVKYVHLGNSGVVIATIISLSIFAIAGPLHTKSILQRMKNDNTI